MKSIDQHWLRVSGMARDSGLLPYDPLSRLDPQIEFEFAINAIHPLVIPSVALHVTQVQKAQPESPVALVVGQTEQVVGNFDILC